MNVELANSIDEQLLSEVLNDDRYEWIRSYDINIKLFYKYGKYDKEGNLKTPALVKNGKAIPLVIKIVSSFNRLTDDVDVKIVINKDLWEEYNKNEKVAALDGILYYLELKTDKLGEPLSISEDNDKVQLKLKKPDFFCEGFNCLVEKYKDDYNPIKDAKSIINLLNVSNDKNLNKFEVKNVELDESETDNDFEINLDDIKL